MAEDVLEPRICISDRGNVGKKVGAADLGERDGRSEGSSEVGVGGRRGGPPERPRSIGAASVGVVKDGSKAVTDGAAAGRGGRGIKVMGSAGGRAGAPDGRQISEAGRRWRLHLGGGRGDYKRRCMGDLEP